MLDRVSKSASVFPLLMTFLNRWFPLGSQGEARFADTPDLFHQGRVRVSTRWRGAPGQSAAGDSVP